MDVDTNIEKEPDGGGTIGINQRELYIVVRTAVKDALMDVLGTVLLLGFALLFVSIGAQRLFDASSTGGSALGGSIVILGFVLAGAALDLIPSIRALTQ
ncbi:hypothetical protein [Halocatena marina]|uniref:hypothetical protein n=1 Tax=Halocatena marina TaxID=2934937 RepID=UPI00200BBEF2|nr:hypothetical protein [Halocatena marina]